MHEALGKVVISPPIPPLISNVSAAETTDPNLIRTLLFEQVTNRVRWREIIQEIKRMDVDTFVEIGTGKVLSNLNKRIDKELKSISLEHPEDIENLLNSI